MKMTKRRLLFIGIGCVALMTLFILSRRVSPRVEVDDLTKSVPVPAVFSRNFKGNVKLFSDGTTLTVRSEGVPDHVTPYWGASSSLYEAQLDGHTVNPGSLQTQTFVMKIPVSPVEATTKEATELGPIGMALNGVAIYNDREGGNVPVNADTLKSFDRGGAHSGPGGLYHYHFDGDFTSYDDAKLIGWLRDGFPIYGTKDLDGSSPADLDDNGGHSGKTSEYPQGVYHYHAAKAGYMGSRYHVLKSGSYYGKKGSFSF
jgi:hypothetical protein